MVLLYAIVPADAACPRVHGLAGRPLECVRGDAVAIVVEEPSDVAAADKEEALRFAGTLVRIGKTTALLPVRFPTVLNSRSKVREEIESRGAEWGRRLEELDGMFELVVRADVDVPVVAEPREIGSGTTYLMQRAAVIHELERCLTELEDLARRWAHDVRRLPTQRGTRFACLIAGDDIPPLREAIRQRRRDLNCRIDVGGPWPPFSFVDEEPALR